MFYVQKDYDKAQPNFEKAVDLLEEAISLNPKAAALRNRLGIVLSIRLKRHTEALEQLRIAIELEPGNIVYMNNFSKVTALLDSQLEFGARVDEFSVDESRDLRACPGACAPQHASSSQRAEKRIRHRRGE